MVGREGERGTAMKVVIPGGSGQVGSVVARAVRGDGHEVVVLSRAPTEAPWRVAAWDAATPGARSVDCRYNAKNRRVIMESRVLSTRVVGEAIARSPHPP